MSMKRLALLLLLVAAAMGAVRNATEQAIHERAWYWQRRLGLDAWTIRIDVVRARDVSGEAVTVWWDPQSGARVATLKVLDPADYQHMTASQVGRAVERNIVHVMLHLVLHQAAKQVTEADKETVIRQLTQALVP
jgi:hypothetical protein